MSQKPHKSIKLPSGWRARLDILLQRQAGSADIKSFLKQPPSIDEKTLNRAESNDDRITLRSFRLLADKLLLRTDEELLTALKSDSYPIEHALDDKQNSVAQRKYRALARDGSFDEALITAKKALCRAEATSSSALCAYWGNRVASAQRDRGDFKAASEYYQRAMRHIMNGLKTKPDDRDLIYISLTTKFGQILTNDFRINGNLDQAHNNYVSLIDEGAKLFSGHLSAELALKLRTGSADIKRQMAKMLYLMGRYKEADEVVVEAESDYPESHIERRSYARLLRADITRQVGGLEPSLTIYNELKELAKTRDLPGLLGAVLIREFCALQYWEEIEPSLLEANVKERSIFASEHGNKYLIIDLYFHLIEASGAVVTRRQAMSLLEEAASNGKVKTSYLRLEAAHFSLCRAELLRAGRSIQLAHKYFRSALSEYITMNCRWGAVRAWIGANLTGEPADLPSWLQKSLEGFDAMIFEEYGACSDCPNGLLSRSIP